jgi:hypothetical protein
MLTTLLIGIIALVLVLSSFGRASGTLRFAFPVCMRFSDLWRWQGTVSRGTYAFVGVTLFAIKHNIDRIVATAAFGRRFTIFNYWIPPTDAIRVDSLSAGDARFLTTMVLMSIPFVWIGLSLTVRRLRSAGIPLGFVALFFAPFVNLVFFAVLCFVPDREASIVGSDSEAGDGVFSPVIPTDPLGSAAMGAILTGLVGSLAVYLGVQSIGVYGWGVFVALPFCMGMASVLIHTYHRPQTLASCLLVSVVSVLVVGVILFALAVEGFVCIIMAVPVATPLAMLGGMFGFLLQRNKHVVSQGSMMCVLAVLPLTLTGVEKMKDVDPPVSIVETSIRIHAPAEKVWRNLVAFSDIPLSNEWLFRLGVAQPIRAVIDGNAVGALRRCDFTTGTFVERIEGWEVNRYFAFSVVSPAEGMREFSPYNIHPRHLDGYFVPQAAEFYLISNDDGTTTLTGTSRYRNAMWPGPYWRLWSDMIIHRVHVRVFDHVKTLSEAANYANYAN